MGRLFTPESVGGCGISSHPAVGIRVLIIEPDRHTALLLQKTLEDLDVYVCGIARDEAETIALARDTHPDLTLIDCGFPGHWDDGIEIAHRLHACLGLRSVFLAPQGDPQALARITASYPLGVVHRPYSESQLKVALDLAVRRLRARTPAPAKPTA